MSQKHFFAGFASGLQEELAKQAGKGKGALKSLKDVFWRAHVMSLRKARMARRAMKASHRTLSPAKG